MVQAIILIIAAVVAIVLLVWILRSRTGGAAHLDTSATAVGAVAEAARNIAEEAAHKIEHVFKDEAPLTPEAPARPAPEPIKVDLTPAPAPVSAPKAAPAAEPANGADNLQQLKGVGPKLAALLTQLGITRFDQIAGWSDADIARVDPQLGAFKGRITRDSWIEQARFLAVGDVSGFEAKFGKLDGQPKN